MSAREPFFEVDGCRETAVSISVCLLSILNVHKSLATHKYLKELYLSRHESTWLLEVAWRLRPLLLCTWQGLLQWFRGWFWHCLLWLGQESSGFRWCYRRAGFETPCRPSQSPTSCVRSSRHLRRLESLNRNSKISVQLLWGITQMIALVPAWHARSVIPMCMPVISKWVQ